MPKSFLLALLPPILAGCSSINGYFSLPDDNAFEETTEAVIHYETGLDVDLTPETPEH